jgi:hypothetical protein
MTLHLIITFPDPSFLMVGEHYTGIALQGSCADKRSVYLENGYIEITNLKKRNLLLQKEKQSGIIKLSIGFSETVG